jgi:Fe-S-cluster containining protein
VPIEQIRGIAGCEHCPFFVGRRCSIHPHRPIDCRTYPLVPTFKEPCAFSFSVSGVCPLRTGVDRPFVSLMTGVWRRLLPRLTPAWKSQYAARQPIDRLERLVNPS